MENTKYLDRHCGLCGNKPVRYVKTLGGFWKLCDSCEGVIIRAGLDAVNEIVRPAAPSAAPMVTCDEPVRHMIAGASSFSCVLQRGHKEDHRAGGTCFTHGPYVESEGNTGMPKCPACVNSVPVSPAAPTVGDHFHLEDSRRSEEGPQCAHGYLHGLDCPTCYKECFYTREELDSYIAEEKKAQS